MILIIEDFYKNRPIRIYSDYSPTLRSERIGLKVVEGENNMEDKITNLRIRKLTPCECWKLMGFTAEDHNKAEEAGISASQRYKQAGNSIVVNVLEKIFKELGEKYEEFKSE